MITYDYNISPPYHQHITMHPPLGSLGPQGFALHALWHGPGAGSPPCALLVKLGSCYRLSSGVTHFIGVSKFTSINNQHFMAWEQQLFFQWYDIDMPWYIYAFPTNGFEHQKLGKQVNKGYTILHMMRFRFLRLAQMVTYHVVNQLGWTIDHENE